MNTIAQEKQARAHEHRSAEQRRLDRLTRQLFHKTEAFGYFVRLFYIEEDDSFFLEWRLPDLSAGSKYFVNTDECYFSLQHCIDAIKEHCEQFDSRLPAAATTVTRCINGARRSARRV